jgi:CubicO group peptidase (beta-lactamase class C family)
VCLKVYLSLSSSTFILPRFLIQLSARSRIFMSATDLIATLSKHLPDNLQAYAEQALTDHNLPAISLAVWKDNQLSLAAAGCLNADTGVEATTDSIFQIGSITKVFTTVLMMKLVERGLVDLDKPVKHYLRDFAVADVEATQTITVKQLLNHSNGIAGDYFPDDQDEDGPHIARYVLRCSQLPLVHPVGDGYSYSNAAFAIAGRLIEVVSGMSWFDAMEQWIYQPLGMLQAICRPADTIRFRAALGHLSDTDNPDNYHTCSGRYLSLGQSPAGTTPTMTAADLIAFGRAHLEGGVTQTGERWLSEETVLAMQQPTNNMPITSTALKGAMGLGWALSTHNQSGLKIVAHTGGTNGQCALLRLFPEHNACFVILLNRQNLEGLMSIGNTLTQAITGVDITAAPTAEPVNLSADQLQPYVGHYHAYAGDFYLTLGANGLEAKFVDAVDEEEPSIFSLNPVGDECFEAKNSQGVIRAIVRFMKPDNEGRPCRLFGMGRLFQRQ